MIKLNLASSRTAVMLSERSEELQCRSVCAAEHPATQGTGADDVIRLAIVHDCALVVAGVGSLLTNEQIEVVETPRSGFTDIDIVLYDPQGFDPDGSLRRSAAEMGGLLVASSPCTGG